MTQTMRGHNSKVTMVTVALAVVLLALTLVVVVQISPKTSDSGSANPAMSADGSGGSSIIHDPYIDRHTEVVARHHGSSLTSGRDGRR
jgi:hypothetical protein